MENSRFSRIVAQRTFDLLTERKALLYPDGLVFWAWPRADRLVLVFDPHAINLSRVNDEFAHYLSTRLQGRRVVRTNSRGLYLQVGYQIPPALVDLVSRPLDLSRQPSAYHLPIGMISNGQDLWISLYDMDSALVSGTRGMGKTVLLHNWVQAMLAGRAIDVHAYDGKGGTEFARYIGQPHFELLHDLSAALDAMQRLASERRLTLLASGAPNTRAYNEAHPDTPMRPIALIVDEAALTTDAQKQQLVAIVERERATGFYPILATNRPEASALLVKSNLITRISFPVPSWNASHMALGQTGAEALPKMPGRGLIVFRARVQEFQGFDAILPDPSTEAVQYILEREQAAITQPTVAVATDGDAERILSLAADGKGESAIIREIWGITGGGSYYKRQTQVREALAKNTTSSTSKPAFGPENAEEVA